MGLQDCISLGVFEKSAEQAFGRASVRTKRGPSLEGVASREPPTPETTVYMRISTFIMLGNIFIHS